MLLRPTREADIPPLAAIIAHAEVERWWGPHDEALLRAELLEDPGVESLTIELDGDVVGLVLVSEENDPQYRHAGLDISLRADRLGQGLGRDALRAVIDHLVAARGHRRFTIDPAAENERAIRCYAAVGFRPVGVMREYERAPDGRLRDGLLMDLLAAEVR